MLRSSKFWNLEAIFFLIDENPKNSCLNVPHTFLVAWRYNILHAIYICYTANDEIYFYNFNPYMDYAPKPWKKADVLIDEEKNHTIMIYRVSANDILILKDSYCELLDFDKTSSLDNYPIKLCGLLNPILLNDVKNSSHRTIQTINDFSGIDSVVAQLIWSKLHTTPTVKIYRDSGYIENNVPHGLVKRIINAEYDMIVNEFYYRSFWRLETYPHGISGMCALTRKRYRSSNISTLLWMFNPTVISIVIPISLLIAIMLKYLSKIGFVNACLKVLGMLAGISINYPISGINRINVAYLVFIMFGLNVYLETSLTSFLVAPDDVYNIDSMEDIVNYKYEVSGRPFVKEFLVDDNFTDVYSENYFDECMDKIRMGHKVACIRDCLSAIFYEKEFDFIHLSKQSVKDIHMTFLFREDWPLRVRFNAIVQRIRESGIIAFVKNIEVFKAYPDRPQYKQQNRLDRTDSREETPLNIKVMSFAWYILGAGITLSSIIFLFELYIIK
ncbi:uncharacterized protein LOC103315653 [Nasonia vitripennis]|uniref:Uncharacterized protein n=1 Tax=Nasonia vitripennis TaxID=7425 RepID=A0A7M7Q5E1_NASVI|nr:uncharacterized protein LOC103315653 [Nasonia vitripennis]